jgi:DNA/RNA endonuclease G (NUC1)
MTRRVEVLCCVLALALAGSGCTRRVTVAARPAIGTVHAVRQAGLTAEEETFRERHCLMGCPLLARGAPYGPTEMVYRGAYVLEHSSIDKIPLWVAERVCAEQLENGAVRKDRFRPDPKLPRGRRAELDDYKRSGFDRGHQAPAANQSRDQALKDEAFYLSNMCPQSPGLNQQAWRELEELTRKWVKQFGTTWQITGPLFYDPAEDDPETADGVLEYTAIGKNRVAVPTHFFKIVVARKGDGDWQAIGFVMENRPYSRPFRFEEYIRPIDWIERRTGLDFLPQMDILEQRRIESAASPLWE